MRSDAEAARYLLDQGMALGARVTTPKGVKYLRTTADGEPYLNKRRRNAKLSPVNVRLLRGTYRQLAADMFAAGAPLGMAVYTNAGTKYLHLRRDGRPFLSKSAKFKRVTWHNCYSYAFDDYALNLVNKPQPGNKSGLRVNTKNCKNIIRAVLADQPEWTFVGNKRAGLRRVRPDAAAVYLVQARGTADYHFYKRKRGRWTHKPGTAPVSAKDAAGRPIRHPDKADHHYFWQHYNRPCGYFVRRADLRKTRSRSRSP